MAENEIIGYDAIIGSGNYSLSDSFQCNFTFCSYQDYTQNGSNSTASVNETSTAFQHDPMLEQFQVQSRFWIQRVLVPIIMIIGVIGNTITIVIMTQRRMRSSTNCYLAALAIFDMSYLVGSFILSFSIYPHIHDSKFHNYWKLWPYILTLTDASSNSSVWLTVTFTIERYIAVCYPMKGKVICTESRAQKMIFVVFLSCFFITLPTAFEWNIIEVPNLVTNSTQIEEVPSELGQNTLYMSIYYWTVSVLFVIIPCILLAVFNAFLIRSVHSSKSQRKTMTRRRETGDQAKQESKITVMLIAVVILFLLCQLPTAVTLLYKSFHDVKPGSNEDLLLRGLGNIFNFLMAINAAGNFVLYCLLSQKYRRTFLQIFCPCLKGNITRLHSVYQNTVYSTMENESPNGDRKYSVRKPGQISIKSSGTPASINQSSVSSKHGFYQSSEETNYRRLLRGFRCPWKRQKVASESSQNENSNQFIPLKSTGKCEGLDSNDFQTEQIIEDKSIV